MDDHYPLRSMVGRHWTELETPALLLDVDLAQRNIAHMAARAAEMPVAVRPHFKAHKCLEIARFQVEAGAIGLTVATLAEAAALLRAGLDNVLVANQLVQPSQIEALAEISLGARITILVDEAANLEAISATARAAGSEVGVMVDVDTGMGRCGVRRVEDARELALLAERLPAVRFDGVSAYEGHCTPIMDTGERAVCSREAIEVMAGFITAIREAGIDVPAVSAGGSTTYSTTGADPRVTEIQPGAYALMDVVRREYLSEFEFALTVVGTVISRHDSLVVLDCGHKAVSARLSSPQLVDCFGEITSVDEEHLRFNVSGPAPRVGDRLQVIPGFGPLTINLYGRFHVISGGVVVDEWPVVARR
jgi:D-serine deaminase-like pyridoxal phosphate-dependent protein